MSNMASKCENYVLSNVIVDAILNDEVIKLLYQRLNEMHSKIIPKVIIISPPEFNATDEYNELVMKIHEQIDFRIEQINTFYESILVN
jgi:hypothetical protein